jgi:hypothetical protein
MAAAVVLLAACSSMLAPISRPEATTGRLPISRRETLIGTVAAATLSLSPRPATAEGELQRGQLIATARKFYSSWNRKDVETAMSCFASNIVFYDAQYDKPFVGSREVRGYLQECADSLPGWSFIIDDFAEDVGHRKLGLRWHVEDSSNIPLPFPTDGLSFLEFAPDGQIEVCRDMVEPTVKTGAFQLPLLRVVSKILGIQ